MDVQLPPLPPPDDKLVKMNCEQKLGDFCLICFSKVDRSKLPSKQDSLLSKNLAVIFLLRNLLQVPSDQLIANFKKCGSPFYWISLCENCSQVTSQAVNHHLQILQLVNQLKSTLSQITGKIKGLSQSFGLSADLLTTNTYQSDNRKDADKKKSMEEKRLEILQRTREFVSNYDYNIQLVNPFIEGDKLAREIEGIEDSISSDYSEQESAVFSDDDDGCVGGELQDEEAIKTQSQRYIKVDDKFKCQYCETLLNSKRRVRYHEQTKHSEIAVARQLECQLCGKKVNTKFHLKSHLCKIHKIDTAGNPIVEIQRPEFKKHVEVDGKWKCRYCDKLYTSKVSVRIHENEKHSENPGKFKCDVCGKIWNSQAYLSKHKKSGHRVCERRLLTEDGKYKCRYCDQEYKIYSKVWTHEQNKHPKIPGQYSCDICGKTCNSKMYLRSHRRLVHKIDAAGNPVVMKPKKPRKYKPHVKLAVPIACKLCGKEFYWKSGLAQHLKYFHEKKYTIRCHVCERGMYTKYEFKMHLLKMHKDDPETIKLVEEGARIWKCEVKGCVGVYSKESGLEDHMKKMHGGREDGGDKNEQKRFACAFCGKTFWYWGKLKDHENLHEIGKDRPYCCDICGAKLKTEYSVKKHKRRFHPENVNT